MTNRKSTRHALFMSAMSILLCIAMLIGSTFAWFTDTAETSVNKIQAGTLDIELQAKTGENGTKFENAEGKNLEFKKADGTTTVLWEPGATYVLPELKIVNNGNLALKYKVVVNGVTGNSNAKLLEAIDFKVKKGTNGEEEKLENWSGILLPDGKETTGIEGNIAAGSTTFTISGTMKTDADNAYQNLTLDGIGITVVATQYTYEYDSIENTYDKDATYPAVLTVAKDVSTSTKTNNNGKTVISTTDNVGVTVKAEAETATTGSAAQSATAPTVTATIPDGVQLEDGATAVALSVVETETAANISAQIATDTVGEAVETKTLDVKLTGVDTTATYGEDGTTTTNAKPIIVEYQNDNLKNLKITKLYHKTTEMTEDSKLDTANDYTFDSKTGTLKMALTSFSPFTIVYDSTSAEIAEIENNYPADGTVMPAGVEIVDNGTDTDTHFVITLKDKEAFLYFTQVFDVEKAYEARKAAGEAGTITKYPSETNCTNLNMWYSTSGITIKMGCDVDLNGMTVSTANLTRAYGPKFDGCGHTISNGKMKGTSGAVGFFSGNISVSNVIFDNFMVSATGADSAAVVYGSVTGRTDITNVTVKNSSVTGAKYTGAIVGWGNGTINVTDCTVKNTTVCGQYKCGGAVGFICCCDNKTYDVQITGNTLTDVTVNGADMWPDRDHYALGKVVGNWCVPTGTCKDNTFTGTTDATGFIGEKDSVVTITED